MADRQVLHRFKGAFFFYLTENFLVKLKFEKKKETQWTLGGKKMFKEMDSVSSLCHRGLAAGIYTTNSAEACQYVAANCEANVLVVENQKQLDKILQVGSFITASALHLK